MKPKKQKKIKPKWKVITPQELLQMVVNQKPSKTA